MSAFSESCLLLLKWFTEDVLPRMEIKQELANVLVFLGCMIMSYIITSVLMGAYTWIMECIMPTFADLFNPSILTTLSVGPDGLIRVKLTNNGLFRVYICNVQATRSQASIINLKTCVDLDVIFKPAEEGAVKILKSGMYESMKSNQDTRILLWPGQSMVCIDALPVVHDTVNWPPSRVMGQQLLTLNTMLYDEQPLVLAVTWCALFHVGRKCTAVRPVLAGHVIL